MEAIILTPLPLIHWFRPSRATELPVEITEYYYDEYFKNSLLCLFFVIYNFIGFNLNKSNKIININTGGERDLLCITYHDFSNVHYIKQVII